MLAIGLMSGTSCDGVSAALVDLQGRRIRLLAYRTDPYPPSLRARLRLEPLEDGPGTGWCTQPCCQEQLALPLDGAR